MQWSDLLLEILLTQAPGLVGLIDFREVVLHFDDGVILLPVEEWRGAVGFEGELRSRVAGRQVAEIVAWKSRQPYETEGEGAEEGAVIRPKLARHVKISLLTSKR